MLALGDEVEHLAARHPPRARRARQLQHQVGTHPRIVVSRRVRENLERQRVQAIPGEDGIRLAERLVEGRLAAPKVGIVHARQVVVDQRIGMNQFDGACGRHRERAVAADCIGAGQTKNRPQTLAAGHEAVLHCLQHDSRAVRSGREDRREYGFDLSEARVEVAGELAGCQTFDSSSEVSVAGAGLSWPRSFRISMRRSASSRRAWQ